MEFHMIRSSNFLPAYEVFFYCAQAAQRYVTMHEICVHLYGHTDVCNYRTLHDEHYNNAPSGTVSHYLCTKLTRQFQIAEITGFPKIYLLLFKDIHSTLQRMHYIFLSNRGYRVATFLRSVNKFVQKLPPDPMIMMTGRFFAKKCFMDNCQLF